MEHAPVILLVEAELSMRILICELLQGSGYTVLDSGSAGEAIQALTEYTGPVELLLIHVDAGEGRSGFNLTESLRSMRPGVKVLLMVDSPEEACGLGESDAFIFKPFTKRSLIRKIGTVLASEDELFRRDCEWIKQLLARRYPQLYVECQEDHGDEYLVRLVIPPGLLNTEVRFSVREYLDGRWQHKISSAVERLDLA